MSAPQATPANTVPAGASGGESMLRVPLMDKAFYGVGEAPITIAMVMFGLFVLFFYSSVMGLPPALVGLASAAGLIWDAVIDPYIGYRSDKSRSRFGRRHVYMLVGALLMGPFLWLLFSPPQNMSRPLLFGWLLTSTILFRFTSAIYRIPYLGLGAEMSSDYHERTVIVAVRSLFGLLGTLLAASLSFVLFFPNRTPGVDPKLSFEGYPRMGLTLGLVMVVCGLAAVFGTKRYRHSPAGSASSPITPASSGFLSGFAAAWGNRNFRSIWLFAVFFFLGVVVNSAVAIHFFSWYVRITDSDSLSRIQSFFYVGALGGVIFWLGLSKRAEKRSLSLMSTVATASLMAAATLLFGEGRPFGTGNPIPLYAGNFLAGFFASAVWVLPGSMLADVADEEDLLRGGRREGIFFGILNFGEKIAAALSLLVGGGLLEYYVQLEPGQVQSAAASNRIGVLYGVIPALFLLLAGVSLRSYRLDRAGVERVQAALAARQ